MEFIRTGGMPSIVPFKLNYSVVNQYLSNIYNTVILKDVLRYKKIRAIEMFNRILLFVMDNIGRTFSANSLKKHFKNEHRSLSVDTIFSYLKFCEDAFIIKKVPRFDVNGKALLKVDEKYYLTDYGFREAMQFSNQNDIERVLENMVLIELLSQDYEVSIGKINKLEVDFNARKNSEIKYFQICYLMVNEETRQREFSSLLAINDNYPKFVL